MPTTPTTIQPLTYAKETILGMTLALEQRFGCQPRNDLRTTLNNKHSVFPTRAPANPRLVQYFTWGVGGRLNDTQTTSSAQYVLGTNMDLYQPRPFRAVPLETDLSAAEMANYAMRVVTMIDGVEYCLYYLKKIDFTKSQVQYVYTNASGAQQNYDIDYANLSPTPPAADSNGVYTDVADSVSIVLPGSLVLTGQEVLESVSVMDGGDMRYAVASELGFVSASAESVSAVDFNSKPFNYTEAICAQMVDQYDWVGQPFLSTTDVFTRQMNFSVKNLIVSS